MAYAQPRYRAQPRPSEPPKKRRRGRVFIAVLLVLLLASAGFLAYVDYSLKREPALPGGADRPQDGPGTNWLLVGSDSRAGLDSEQQTVESNTGVRVDHYAEVGLGGFAGITDAVGGVNTCVKEPMQDPKANLDLQPGCQTLRGPQALGYVRSRASADGDLDRIQRQRQFLAALTEKVSSPQVLANPFRLLPLILDTSQSFRVDSGDHVWHLGALGFAMQGIASGEGVTTTVPFGGFGETDDGASVVEWDSDAAQQLFGALANDAPVPPDVITGPADAG